MKRQFITLIVFSACLLAGSALADTYWVSFNGDDGHGIYMMQINETGKILRAPLEVVTEAAIENCDCSTAIGNHGEYLYLWITNEESHLFGVHVEKETVKAESKPKIFPTLINTDDVLACTQNANLPFIALLTKGNVYRALGVKSSGFVDGTSWRLSPRTEGGAYNSTISADGEMSVVVNTESSLHKIYAQALRASNSRPIGDPVVVGNGKAIGSVDVTNILGNGLRLVVYGDTHQHKIFGQFVHPVSAQKVGSPKLIANLWDPEEASQNSLAVDPLGRFLLFTHYPAKCNHNDLIYFVPLTATGTAAGTIKELVGCSFTKKMNITDDLMGLDIMREP
jgi:hypothetical protein